jgi:glucose-6-phosphate 1-dehydrogenase
LFYFAIPPNVFGETAIAIKQTCMQNASLGWTRLIVEKPFGRDSESFEELNATLSEHFTEDHLYRIGKDRQNFAADFHSWIGDTSSSLSGSCRSSR